MELSTLIEQKEKQYCELMRKAYAIAQHDRTKSGELQQQALMLKKELHQLQSKLYS